MARVRNLSPLFFTDAAVVSCSPLARLMFAGLWCHADRAGRLRDRPEDLCISILPRDSVSGDALLGELSRAGLVIRYESGGDRFIQIRSFGRYQRPHPKESESTIPAFNSNQSNNAVPISGESLPFEGKPGGLSGPSGSRAFGTLPSGEVKYIPPATVEEVSARVRERGIDVDPEDFVAWYSSNGWVVGKAKAKMKNWDAALTTFSKRNKSLNGNGVSREIPSDGRNTSPPVDLSGDSEFQESLRIRAERNSERIRKAQEAEV